MPWTTPSLRVVRSLVRDAIRASLPGSDATPPNSVLRVLSDAMGALCHLVLQYIDWLALQLLPDTAETEWLDRHGQIWIVNSDGTIGRKLATLSQGSASFTGALGVVIPANSLITATTPFAGPLNYETTADIALGSGPTAGPVRAIDPGSDHNLAAGMSLSLSAPPVGADSLATVLEMDGGVDDETDDDLRARVLFRIQQPPMGGDVSDYVQWTLSIPGVTRAWCVSEMGPGTVTVRFMMDEIRADNDGFPLPVDCAMVKSYLDTVRPVSVKDLFVVSPIPMFVDLRIANLSPNTTSMVNAIESSLLEMFAFRGAPGQIFYRAWCDEAIINAGTNFYDLTLSDAVPPSNGHLAVLGDVIYT